MNIKRAFMALAAALIMPGLALAQSTIEVEVMVFTTNGGDATVNAALECTNGLPLTQDDDISTGTPGTDFVVSLINTGDPDTNCAVTFSNLPAGYTVSSIDSNGDESVGPDWDAPHCSWDGEANLETDNYCHLYLEPLPFNFSVTKEWVGDDNISNLKANVEWECQDVADTTYGEFYTATGTFHFYGPAPGTQSTGDLYPHPDGGSKCTADEKVLDSAVEVDTSGCPAHTFEIGDDYSEQDCTIVNTLFFEGIPTLSQYGLAVMALLMLGVGFVGFRRFV